MAPRVISETTTSVVTAPQMTPPATFKNVQESKLAPEPFPHEERPLSVILKVAVGALFAFVIIPPVACVVGVSTIWYHIDPVTQRLQQKFHNWTKPYYQKWLRNPEDTMLINIIIYSGILIPCFFAYALYDASQHPHSFNYKLAFLYNLLRIGPYFLIFAVVYVSSHKEGHRGELSMFTFEGIIGAVFKNIFNWWIGPFYGMFPGNFRYGHTKNHHKYDNSEQDVISTWDLPRDSVINFLAYLPRFTLYVFNVSSIISFLREGQTELAVKLFVSNVYVTFLTCALGYISVPFVVCYVFYPFAESIILLAAINWAWHCFVDPADPDNEYASSITILDGPMNVFNEDFHVVHHQFPGAHWTKHPELYTNRIQSYQDRGASIVRNTHALELFFMVILKDYKTLAEKWVDMSDRMTLEDKILLVKARLRAVAWGPLKNMKGIKQN